MPKRGRTDSGEEDNAVPTPGKTKAQLAAAKRQETKERREAEKRAAQDKKNNELASWVKEHDTMIEREVTVAIDQLFNKVVKNKDFQVPKSDARQNWNWSVFSQQMEQRTKDTKEAWFIQCRSDDLLLEPDGLTGIKVDNFVVAATESPTLAPKYYIVKEHRVSADIEDNAPERVMDLDGQSVKWIPIVHSDGSGTNSFLLHRPTEVQLWSGVSTATIAGGASFSFGIQPSASTAAAPASAPPPAPSVPAPSAPTQQPSFGLPGFGSAPIDTASPAAIAPTLSFGLVAPAAPPRSQSPTPQSTETPAQQPSFGFGLAASSPAAPANATNTGAIQPSFSFGVAPAAAPKAAEPVLQSFASFGQVDAVPQLKPNELCFCLWSSQKVKEMRKDLKAGTRIVKPNFPLSDDGRAKIKLVMQSDMTDDVDATVYALVTKLFAKEAEEISAVDTWIDDCPEYDEKLMTALQKFRNDFVKRLCDDSDEFKELEDQYAPKIKAELERIVKLREEEVGREDSVLQTIGDLLKESKIAERNEFRILKYYPQNDVCPFRPFGKVTGISEAGESADVCEPPAYVFKNAFAQQG